MGNSEVGHMNLGAGRIVYQDLTRVDAAIADGSFYSNAALSGAARAVSANGRTLHLMGLVSPGGVHSHELQILAMLDLAGRAGAKVAVHAFLDGRDTPPRSALASLEALTKACAAQPHAQIATVGGRYFAMDRDQRWDRVARAWDCMVDAKAQFDAPDAQSALNAAYERGENDEFVQPTTIAGGCPMLDGDAVVFMNFRADRARQLTSAFVRSDFSGFDRARTPKLADFVSLTEYAADLPTTVAFRPQSMAHTLPQIISEAGLTQLRIAETEKYAHVTFFFNGGREEAFPGEQRIMVPSPKVATYDLQPEMSCPELTKKLVAAIVGQQFDFIVCNIANPDMVGHTGDLGAAIKAVEAVDQALGALETAILSVGGEMLICADHGNLEDMWDEESNQANTQHTTNPVPLVYVGRPAVLRDGGSLRDIAPSLLALLGLPQPAEMTGQNLIDLSPAGG